ncbi:MAG: protein-L-isoaspartate(D-aspartate) O-methyltransferase [Deltaproteobacteria bacterium]|nr:protein-L-isoaspartate(D-aspartate) O-methyltransferase [Deltaproteobacteria bacterium]MBW2052319.1 protein-L-isoaspartate(D-aspartate) O-methyltransferase [Deltaproteobacteria bacterium]MBW2142272.1 protein-L-isoaspartate(D-aspartate) O-methyltransferase [Deltaproteobacteria bacterium]
MSVLSKRCILVSLCLFLPLAAYAKDDRFIKKRLSMVEDQIQRRGIKDARVLEAMRQVPRHLFVGPRDRSLAYADRPLPIGYGQTISQPYIVAYMTEILRLLGTEKVLEIGTGSGYQAAILAKTAGEVYSIEIIPGLYNQARKKLSGLGYGRVYVKVDDGYFGWPDKAPFDRIIVTCAAGHIPPPLIKQLKPGGMMVIPVGQPWMVQTLILVKKDQEGQIKTRALMPVRFVPLVRMK